MAGRPKQFTDAENYERHKARVSDRERKMSASTRDIGQIPAAIKGDLKEECRFNLELYCTSFFPDLFPLDFSDDHRTVIASLERSILEGDLSAVAMPRGSGKTTLTIIACMWAITYGHRRFFALIGATESHANNLIAVIKSLFANNDNLLDAFPEIAFPIRCLQGLSIRCNGQLCEGQRTEITWQIDKIVFPTIPGSEASGSVVMSSGITGAVRGLMHLTADGELLRPDIFIADDPQTDESAASPSQTAKRLKTLTGTIEGLCGPTVKMSGVVPCTVIQPGDLADQLLDRKKYPQYHGIKTKMLVSFPDLDALKLWENEYDDIRRECLTNEEPITRATEYYLANMETMNRGAKVSWEQRFNQGEASAIQNAMNLWLKNRSTFMAEYQNDPEGLLAVEGAVVVDAKEIIGKTNEYRLREVPEDTSKITGFIDVQKRLLYWYLIAWNDYGGGKVIGFGVFPDQNVPYFVANDARQTFDRKYKNCTVEVQIGKALNELVGFLVSFPLGSRNTVDAIMIDANWSESRKVVYQFCQSFTAVKCTPSHGRGVLAADRPMSEWKHDKGDRKGDNWRIPYKAPDRVRHCVYDTNFWKSRVKSKLLLPLGHKEGIEFHHPEDPQRHKLMIDHLVSEYSVETAGRGRRVDVWSMMPGRPDNHWWDCLVGAAVCGSTQGVQFGEAKVSAIKKKRKRAVVYDI
jgi:hypothetical protein